MIRYRLDDLGWYQFEWLIQALLKSHCGLAVEDWSANGGDFGKDAFCVHEPVERQAAPCQVGGGLRRRSVSNLHAFLVCR